MAYKSSLTKEYVDNLILYNPETGDFIWKERDNKVFNKRYAGKIAGTNHDTGYIVISINNKLIFAHRLAYLIMMGTNPQKRIDHINQNKCDNRWENLREASHADNLANTSIWKNNTSGKKGVSWDKSRGKWQAKIKNNGKIIHLGRYNNIQDAADAYNLTASKIYGDFYNGQTG